MRFNTGSTTTSWTMHAFTVPLLLLLSNGQSTVHATKYHLIKDYTSSGVDAFFDAFDFYSEPDPTNGFVQYLDRDSAVSTGLAGHMASSANYSTNSIYMGVDHASPATYPGRPSVRISSKAAYGPGTLLLADVLHAPVGICGAWPALWMLGTADEWPLAGEFDIFEQVNLATANSVTLHTGSGCALQTDYTSYTGNYTGSFSGAGGRSAAYSGSLITADCDVDAPDQPNNAGCSIVAPTGSDSFGAAFNEAGGGVYVAEWMEKRGFNVWFVPRGAVTDDAQLGPQGDSRVGIVDTRRLGTPLARFAGPGCDWDASFRDMQIIINTALCGDWAGDAWVEGGCAASTGVATCEEYVADSPGAFEGAYWELGSLRVYEKGKR